MNEREWDESGITPLEHAGTAARNMLVLFGCMFVMSAAAQVDPSGIAAKIIGDEAPMLVKLCGSMMAICLGIIYWQQRELSAMSRQSRSDFRDMIRTTNRFMDYIDGKMPQSVTYVDEDVASVIRRRTKDGNKASQ